MPSWKIHKLIDKLLTDKEHEDVHWFLDHIGVLIKGDVKGHRQVWGHDIKYVIMLYLLTHDIDKVKSAIAHLILDKSLTYEQSKILEYLIKLLNDNG